MKKVRREDYNNIDENKDRLSALSDCVLLHILSFLNTKRAVQTCVLSKRWKNLWKCLPTVTISSLDFEKPIRFTEFMSKFLSLRDDSTTLHTLNFHSKGFKESRKFERSQIKIQIKRILKYAVLHNVRKLQINVKHDIESFLSCFFSCRTLTSLNLSVAYYQKTLFPSYLDFPALTSLSLQCFIFGVEPFSTFKMLNSLIIRHCKAIDKQNICISSATLVNLTIEDCEFELYTPSLRTFVYNGIPIIQKLCWGNSNLSSVKHVKINTNVASLSKSEKTSSILHNWLVELANMESLTICSNTLEILYLLRNKRKVEYLSLYNLKSVKIKTYRPYISNGILDFLLRNVPSAKVDLIHANARN